MIWFTADLHFNHDKIITYSRRPFTYVRDMNDALIENWNSVVGATDTVYVLGDFGFKGHESLFLIFNALKGQKHLILGNHDEQNRDVRHMRWESQLSLKTIKWEGHRFELCHYPLETWKKAQIGALHLHGHSHGSLKRVIPHRYDVGVDASIGGVAASYRPRAITDIVAYAQTEVFDAQDHHGD